MPEGLHRETLRVNCRLTDAKLGFGAAWVALIKRAEGAQITTEVHTTYTV